jgi:hypothetical protein
VLAANAVTIEEYRAGKDKLFGFFVGQVVKATRARRNPCAVNEILLKRLTRTGVRSCCATSRRNSSSRKVSVVQGHGQSPVGPSVGATLFGFRLGRFRWARTLASFHRIAGCSAMRAASAASFGKSSSVRSSP